MRTVLGKVVGIVAIAAGLGIAGTVSAVPIVVAFNFVPTTGMAANTGDISTATTITSGAPDLVTQILPADNTGVVGGQTVVLSPAALPVTIGAQFTKTWTTALGIFTETLTVTSRTFGPSSLGIEAIGTVTCVACGTLTSSPVFYSAAYTQNGGPSAQINASFNNSTTPPRPDVPEPATLALLGLGLAGLGFSRRRKQQ